MSKKVTMLNSSPRGGNTEALANALIAGAESKGQVV